MDLDLTIPPARGRRPADVEFGYLRDLDENDVLILGTSEPLGATTPAIKKIRDSHHKLASLLASGLKDVEVSLITGYSQSRISILKHDPAFKNLLSFYAESARGINIEVMTRLKDLGIDAVQELHSRLDERRFLNAGSCLRIEIRDWL